jgi:hypothetical protein
MSRPKFPEPVKLVSSVFSGNKALLDETIERMSDKFGNIDYITEYIPFEYTDYYKKEMGGSLIRRFIAFEKLIRPEDLPDVKLYTNIIEEEFSKDGKRPVNIDPGYISLAHLILATGKAYTHRPYIGKGIYADLTLIYVKHSFRALEWTYPDYSDKKTIKMFNDIRSAYAVELNKIRTTGNK